MVRVGKYLKKKPCPQDRKILSILAEQVSRYTSQQIQFMLHLFLQSKSADTVHVISILAEQVSRYSSCYIYSCRASQQIHKSADTVHIISILAEQVSRYTSQQIQFTLYLFLQSKSADTVHIISILAEQVSRYTSQQIQFTLYQHRNLRLVLSHVFWDTADARTVFCWTLVLQGGTFCSKSECKQPQ